MEAASLCGSDSRAMQLQPGLRVPGTHGLEVELVDLEPFPAVRGDNRWRVRVHGAGSVDVADLQVSARPFMPDHGHGTSIIPASTRDDEDTGTFSLYPIYLGMPGYWETALEISDATGTLDEVVLTLCIEG